MNRSIILLGLVSVLLCTLPSFSLADPLVLFDESHAQQFLIDRDQPLDLSDLATSYRNLGYDVVSQTAALSSETLAPAKVLVISGAFRPLADTELQAVLNFVGNGGGLLILLHIAPPVGDLLHALEVDFTNGSLRESTNLIDDNPLDFRVSHLAEHPITNGLADFSVYGSWALRSTGRQVQIVAETSQQAWVDLDRDNQFSSTDAMQKFGVMAAGELGRGRFVVVGDDALFQNRFFDPNNRQLAGNILDWLVKR